MHKCKLSVWLNSMTFKNLNLSDRTWTGRRSVSRNLVNCCSIVYERSRIWKCIKVTHCSHRKWRYSIRHRPISFPNLLAKTKMSSFFGSNAKTFKNGMICCVKPSQGYSLIEHIRLPSHLSHLVAFQRIASYLSKVEIFPNPRIFGAPVGWPYQNLIKLSGTRKTESVLK